METIYLILVIVLFILAISDLIVGVSNDAVNFLNSAFGSKSASFKTIMIVASVGVLVGATFSNGMMEVARKSIFNPQHFYFSEIMIIFLAVMITDVILLDMFNTFGMPTSTTVSIVFELLGAAVAVSIIKTLTDPNALQFIEYINAGKALGIISGILLSVVVAFSVGAIVQFFSRLLFSFNYEKRIKYLGAVFGGVAISAITYFILIKGAHGSSFITDEMQNYIDSNTLKIVLMSFVFWSLLLQILTKLFKINVLKIVVLMGTFALAMAFAGNDLVNFIGVPLAGLESFKAFIATPGATPDSMLMGALVNKIHTPTIFLLIAGLIMVTTLVFSKKARSVVDTSLNLARQNDGYERFQSNPLARAIVRSSSHANRFVSKLLPQTVKNTIKKQFNLKDFEDRQRVLGKAAPVFDEVRASVTLVVASILIALGTSLKLPLSTTYVTFMVAMGTSLSDQAWGRESAVYRISGVLSVIGGWFFTAFSAFTLSFVFAYIIYYGGFVAVFALVALAGYFVYKTHSMHKKRSEDDENMKSKYIMGNKTEGEIISEFTDEMISVLESSEDIIKDTFCDLSDENLKGLKNTFEKTEDLRKKTKMLKNSINSTIKSFSVNSVEVSHHYIQMINCLRETSHCISYIVKPSMDHVDNHHKPLVALQKEELQNVYKGLEQLFNNAIKIIMAEDFNAIPSLEDRKKSLLELIDSYTKKQIKRIKANEVGTKNSLVYMKVLGETKNLILYILKLLKCNRDFINSTSRKQK